MPDKETGAFSAPWVLRRARASDAPALAQLCSGSMGYAAGEGQVRRRLEGLLPDDSQLLLVAEAQGRVVGYLHAQSYQVLYAPAMKNILGLAVLPQWRRRGIASALLTAAEEWARGTGAEAVRLCSGEERAGAHAFYRARGYRCDKRQLNFKKQLPACPREEDDKEESRYG